MRKTNRVAALAMLALVLLGFAARLAHAEPRLFPAQVRVQAPEDLPRSSSARGAPSTMALR